MVRATRWYAEPAFRGCALLNAAAQHHDDSVLSLTARHLDRYRALLADIATRAGACAPALLAGQLLVLVEGATVVAAHQPSAAVADAARSAALALLSISGSATACDGSPKSAM
jgi:hypothetical protein